jgi:hypothetical protein
MEQSGQNGEAVYLDFDEIRVAVCFGFKANSGKGELWKEWD